MKIDKFIKIQWKPTADRNRANFPLYRARKMHIFCNPEGLVDFSKKHQKTA